MRRKILGLTLLFVITTFLTMLNVSAGEWGESGDYTYWLENGSIQIVEYIGTDENLLIPNTIDGYPVTEIQNRSWRGVFVNNQDILTSIVIPNGITVIGNGVFEGCTALTFLDMPNSLAEIGNGAFKGCISLASINIPDSVIHIGSSAFVNCTSLTSLFIPSNVVKIGSKSPLKEGSYYVYNDNLIAGCTSLATISVDPNNEYFSSDEQGILYNKDKTVLIVCPPDKSGIVKVPDGVIEITENAFRDFKELLGITLPDSLKNIGRSAFENCISLSEIIIPDGVESIGSSAFEVCAGLTELSIPGSVTSIDSYAFRGLTNLKTVVIQSGVKNIGHSAFSSCANLLSVDIPNSVETIGHYAFQNCSSLTELIIPDSVTNISDMMTFANCTSLVSVTLPRYITKIGYSWFRNCQSLKSINIPDSVTEIGQYAFQNCANLTKIEIPLGVVKILSYAFNGCESLTEIDMPNSVKQADYYAFMDCISLKSVRLSNRISIIDHHTFSGCTSLTYIEIPKSAAEIKYAAFKDCTSLTAVVFNNPDTIIEENGYVIPALMINPRDGGHPEIVCSSTFDNCYNLNTVYGFTDSTAQTFAYNKEKSFTTIVKVQLNEIDLVFDVPPQLINDRTMVPMRKIFEILGADIEWNDDTKTITATSSDVVVTMQINNPEITVNGENIMLDVPPQLVNNRILVPVRAVAEGLSAKVEWDNEAQTVIITKQGLSGPVTKVLS